MAERGHAKHDTQVREFAGLRYVRYAVDRGPRGRGTLCLVDNADREIRVIPAFPHINRVYCLAPGLRKLFGDEPFFAEEKMDGYNTRVFWHDGRLIAATRGGFVCPFTTEWIGLWKERCGLGQFFADHADCILCCEICGDVPYHCQRDPRLPPGAHWFVFDIIGPGGLFLPPADRHRLADRYGLPAPPVFGQFTAGQIEQVYELLRDLNERHREGVVLKGTHGHPVLKFVTPNSDLTDLRHALLHQFDLQVGFFRNRLLRMTLFIDELGLDQQDYARRIGEAYLDGFRPLQSYHESSEVGDVYVRSPETWEATRAMMTGQVIVLTDSVEPVELDGRPMLKIHFRRVFRKSTGRYRTILKGFPHTD
jgi:putative ATP-dependent DNA ligase